MSSFYRLLYVLFIDLIGGNLTDIIFIGWDVGVSDLIIKDKIIVKQGVEISHFKPNSVVFSDGSEHEADAVIYAYVLLLDHPVRYSSNKSGSRVFCEMPGQGLRASWNH